MMISGIPRDAKIFGTQTTLSENGLSERLLSINLRCNSNKSIASLSQGRAGNEENINGSVGTGRSFAQVTHLKTVCPIDVDRRPGAKTIKKSTNSTKNKSQTHRAKQ